MHNYKPTIIMQDHLRMSHLFSLLHKIQFEIFKKKNPRRLSIRLSNRKKELKVRSFFFFSTLSSINGQKTFRTISPNCGQNTLQLVHVYFNLALKKKKTCIGLGHDANTHTHTWVAFCFFLGCVLDSLFPKSY